jgi:site-specific DNA-methyltransferase (adenine-specific)
VAVERNGGGGRIFGAERTMAARDDFGYGDTGTYSRFFLIPKASRADRELTLAKLPKRFAPTMGNGIGAREHDPSITKAHRANTHTTVKPVRLMRHLVRLVTPPGGLVLDPFLGSGTTGLAAEAEGFRWVGIELDPESVAIAEARLDGWQRGLGLADEVPA